MAVFFAGPLIIIVLLIVLLSAALFVVPQQQAYIIERFGKFLKVQFAGIHIRIPFVDRIAMKTNMRVNQLNVQLETKTLDNVFVTVVASTQFRAPTWRTRCVPLSPHCLWTMPLPARTMWRSTCRRPWAPK